MPGPPTSGTFPTSGDRDDICRTHGGLRCVRSSADDIHVMNAMFGAVTVFGVR
jgi:hypothetical protein